MKGLLVIFLFLSIFSLNQNIHIPIQELEFYQGGFPSFLDATSCSVREHGARSKRKNWEITDAVKTQFLNRNVYTFYQHIESQPQDTSEIFSLLQQSYTYLGEGSQMMAFVSDDGAYVLKLFKAHHKHPFKFSRFVRHLMRTQQDRIASQKRWDAKFTDTCRRYEMAFSYLKDETALVHLHFTHTEDPLPVTLVHHKSERFDLSKFPFVIQKKAMLAPEYFRQHPRQAKQALKDFFTKRLEKGFSDPRQTLSKNYGFIDDTPIQVDPGKIEPFVGDSKAELEKIHAHVDEWASTF